MFKAIEIITSKKGSIDNDEPSCDIRSEFFYLYSTYCLLDTLVTLKVKWNNDHTEEIKFQITSFQSFFFSFPFAKVGLKFKE